MSGLPAIRTSGFGIVSVSGRMRVPRPAANTMAQRGVFFRGAHQTFSAGTLVRYQAASGARSGWANDRCR